MRAGPGTPQWELEDKWEQVEATLKDVRFFGDLAIEAFFLETKVKAREVRRRRHLDAVLGWAGPGGGGVDEHRERLEAKRKASPTFAPFHWEVEFPEVFERRTPGFDAFVGNPPFGGHVTLVQGNLRGYTDWLREIHPATQGKCDVVAHFFRRSFDLLRDDGTFGLIATNTIGQGDTRQAGLRWICTNGGELYHAQRRFKWPGLAAVVVSVVHCVKGQWWGGRLLDGRTVERITAFLFHGGGHENPARIEANSGQSFVGSYILGMGFTFDDMDKNGVASPLADMKSLVAQNPRNAEVILPYIGGQEVNTSPYHRHHRYVINFRDWPLNRQAAGSWEGAGANRQAKWLREHIVPLDYPGPVAADWKELLDIVEAKVRPQRLRAALVAGRAMANERLRYGGSMAVQPQLWRPRPPALIE